MVRGSVPMISIIQLAQRLQSSVQYMCQPSCSYQIKTAGAYFLKAFIQLYPLEGWGRSDGERGSRERLLIQTYASASILPFHSVYILGQCQQNILMKKTDSFVDRLFPSPIQMNGREALGVGIGVCPSPAKYCQPFFLFLSLILELVYDCI